MSVYNNANFVSKAIESILNQTFTDFEFIIVDDGCTDDTLEIIKNFAQQDKRIKIIRNRINIGLTKSLNKAIKRAQGEHIARQDADDISLPQRFERQLTFLERHPNYAFCGGFGEIRFKSQIRGKFYEIDEIRRNLIIDNCFPHTSVMIRKSILEKYGYYDEKYLYSQDYELWARLIYKYHLLAKNLKYPLVIRGGGKLNKRKYFIQRFNSLRCKLGILRYTKHKLRCTLSIFYSCFEVLTFSSYYLRYSIYPYRERDIKRLRNKK